MNHFRPPDTMEFLGAKDALHKIVNLNVGLEDTLAYYSLDDFSAGFQKTMAFQPRVIEQSRYDSIPFVDGMITAGMGCQLTNYVHDEHGMFFDVCKNLAAVFVCCKPCPDAMEFVGAKDALHMHARQDATCRMPPAGSACDGQDATCSIFHLPQIIPTAFYRTAHMVTENLAVVDCPYGDLSMSIGYRSGGCDIDYVKGSLFTEVSSNASPMLIKDPG